jgi:uncharacterized membrane protein
VILGLFLIERIKSMTIREMRMVVYILVTGFMFMTLFSCANHDLHRNEDYVEQKKTFVSSERQEPDNLILSK